MSERDDKIREILALPDAERALAYWEFARQEYASFGGDLEEFDREIQKPIP